MLSLLELKYHCRTCLIKIESFGANEVSKNYVAINKYPEVEQFMGKCLGINDMNSLGQRLDLYMPNICCICLEKWKDFSCHHLLAVKNEELLRKILEREESFEAADEKHPNKVFLPTDTTDEAFEVEKYETISPFYPTSKSNTLVVCQNEEKHKNDGQISYSNKVEDKESLQSSKVNTIESDEECLLKYCKYSQPVDKQINKIKTKKQTCRSKRKSEIDQPNNKIKDENLDESNETTTKKVAYRCGPCKKFFYGSITYEGHIKCVHEGVKKAYQCKECEKAYSSPYNLAEHIASVHGKLTQGKTLQCEHCNKPYKSKASLAQHLRNHHQHKNPESKRIICDQCGFLAAHQMSLAQHIKNIHSEVEEIKCDQCSKVFKSRYYLKYHMLSFHNPMNIKPFKCPQCPKAFARRPRLNTHIRNHLTYAERIKCDFEDHIHTGEKPYKCNVCEQAFRQLTSMKTHRKMHAKKVETKRTVTTTTYSDILNILTHNNDGGFEGSSNGFE